MATRLRIAAFNLENLDDKPGQKPTWDQRIALLHVLVWRAPFAYLQCAEVHHECASGMAHRWPRSLRAGAYACRGYSRAAVLTGGRLPSGTTIGGGATMMERDPDVERYPPHGGEPVNFPPDPERERKEREEKEEEEREEKEEEEREEDEVRGDVRA